MQERRGTCQRRFHVIQHGERCHSAEGFSLRAASRTITATYLRSSGQFAHYVSKVIPVSQQITFEGGAGHLRTYPIVAMNRRPTRVSRLLYGERNADAYIRCVDEADGRLSISLDSAQDRDWVEALGQALEAGLVN